MDTCKKLQVHLEDAGVIIGQDEYIPSPPVPLISFPEANPHPVHVKQLRALSHRLPPDLGGLPAWGSRPAWLQVYQHIVNLTLVKQA